MKTIFYLLLFFLGFATLNTNAQNVFDPNDPDWVFYKGMDTPALPPSNIITKWGHSLNSFGWNTYTAGYKSYRFDGISFRLKYPKTLDPQANDGKKYPIYVFIHGAGEPGGPYDNQLHLIHGAQFHAQQVDNGNYDGFLLYAQSWTQYSTALLPKVKKIIDSLAKYVKADIDRVVVGGLSSGGSGVLYYLEESPETWAAGTPISPIISSGFENAIPGLVSIPLWISNGGKDKNPDTNAVKSVVNKYLQVGGDIRHSLFPSLGHGVWNNFWAEPGYIQYLNDAHKAQPVVRFNHTEWCDNEDIETEMILQPGFYQYEWQKDGVTIAGATSSTYFATEFGAYRARFKRKANSDWSEWSPRPVVVSSKGTTVNPPIEIDGLHSNVLPAPDGSVTVPLIVPTGYASYEWVRASDNLLMGTSNVFEAPVGEYKLRVTEQFGCSSSFSDPYVVIPASGANSPDGVTNVLATTLSNRSIEISWTDNPSPTHNETGFEIYRSKTSGENYELIGIVPADSLDFIDENLDANTTCFYIIRSINGNGAGPVSNEVNAKTLSDVTPPSAPNNLAVVATTRTSVSLSWSEAWDDVGIKNYEIYIDGQKAFVTGNTYFDVNGLDSFVNYSFYIVAVDLSDNKSVPSSQVTAFTKLNGLNYSVYQGDWDNLPDFNALTPVKRGIEPNINLSVSPYADYFGMVWEGWLNVPNTGTYTFYLSSDDGSALYIDQDYVFGASPLINNDGLHGNTEKSASKSLAKGWHKIIITFFEKTGSEVLTLSWSKSSNPRITKQIIPASYFSDSQTPPGSAPAKPTNISAAAESYDIVTVGWQDKSNNETGFEIYRKKSSENNYQILERVDANITSYSDSTVEAGTTYNYQVQAVNNNGQSGFNGSATVTTPAAPPIPDVPVNLSLEALSPVSASISFSGSGHTGFEVYRSIGNMNQFRIFKSVTTTENDVTLIDSGLFAHTMVYYQVRAVGVSGKSEFTDPDSVFTLNSDPGIKYLGEKFIYYAGSSVIPVQASDVDGDQLTFTFTDLPAFGSFDSTGNGTGNLIFNTQISDQGRYDIVVTVDDGFGGTASETLSLIVNDNRPPQLGRVRSFEVNEGEVLATSITATDPDRRTTLNFSFIGAPDFVDGINSGNEFSVLASPEYGDAGEYTFYVRVDDNKGGLDSSLVTLVVNFVDPNRKVYMNLAKSSPLPDSPWNNITQSVNQNLLNDKGEQTGIGLAFSPTGFYTSSDGMVTGDNSGVYPDIVMRDNFYFGIPGQPSRDTIRFTLSGLIPEHKYNLTIFASSTYGVGSTVYETAGETKSIPVHNNTSERAIFNSLYSDAEGKIVVKMSKDIEANVGYLNALILEDPYDDGKVPAAPQNLIASSLPDGSISLKWNSAAYNAHGFQLLRCLSIDGDFSVIGNGNIPGQDTLYIDTDVNSNKNYFYKILAFNDYGNSDTVGIAHALTLNRAPEMQDLNDVFLAADNSESISIEASDDPEDDLTITVEGLPGFASYQNTGNGTGTINFSPSVGDEGVYKNIKVTVADNYGAQIENTFNITVGDNEVRTTMINFNGSEVAPWNNFVANPISSYTMTNIVDGMNELTPYSFKFTTNLGGKSEWGMEAGDNGLYSEEITRGAVFVNNNNTYTMQFAGLNSSKRYNIAIFSSYNTGTPGTATFSSGGKSAVVNGSYNLNKNGYLINLTPNAQGIIEVNFVKNSSSDYFLLNAVKLEEYNTNDFVKPFDLIAESALSTSSIKLNWSDRSDQETGYQVYRSTNPNSGFSLVTTTSANVTTFTDNSSALQPGTTYYYKIRGRKGSSRNPTYTNYSNVASFTLAKSLTLLNINIPDLEQGSPWNNTSHPGSSAGVRVENMMNTNNIKTGVDFEIVEEFNGKGFEGVNGTGIFPVLVMRSNYWTDAGQVSSAKFSGLDMRQTYRIGVFNSLAEKTGRYFGIYTINGESKSVNGQSNNSFILYFDDIRPDENGEILISVTPDTRYSPYCFTNAFTIEGYMKPEEGQGQAMFNNNRGTETTTVILPENSLMRSNPVEDQQNQIHIVKLNAYPNPFVTDLKAEIELPASVQKVKLELFDLQSRLIVNKEITNNRGIGGKQVITLSVGDKLSPGVYLLKLTADAEQKTIKLLKAY